MAASGMALTQAAISILEYAPDYADDRRVTAASTIRPCVVLGHGGYLQRDSGTRPCSDAVGVVRRPRVEMKPVQLASATRE